MSNSYENQEMKTVNNGGFVTSSFWDKSIHLMTIDGEGNEVDCYDRVVDDLKDKEDNVIKHYKKEERKNKWINFRYNLHRKMLITNIGLTFFTFFMYIIFVIYKKIDIIYSAEAFIADNLYAPLYKKLSQAVAPINNCILEFVKSYGLENIFNYTLMILSIVSFISLIIYVVSRDHITVRWVIRLVNVKPLCKIKADSDNRVSRLKADLYKLQLRQHKVKFATHER